MYINSEQSKLNHKIQIVYLNFKLFKIFHNIYVIFVPTLLDHIYLFLLHFYKKK